MVISDDNYISFSALSYIGFNNGNIGLTLGDLIDNEQLPPDKLNEPQLSALANWDSPLRSYTLISFLPNTLSGFAAAAFQAPPGPNGEPGQIVFAFRGTEPDTIDVYGADVEILLQTSMSSLPSQFTDAETFVSSILSDPANINAPYSFTGHSLGGAIASYMTNTDLDENQRTTFESLLDHLKYQDTILHNAYAASYI